MPKFFVKKQHIFDNEILIFDDDAHQIKDVLRMREGDIITAVNGKTGVTSDDILAIRDSLQVGDVITFTIWRDGESSDVEVIIGDMNDIY